MAYLILEPDLFPEDSIKKLEKLDEVFLGQKSCERCKEDIVTVFVRLGFYIDQCFMGQYPNCKFIVSPTTGLNHLSEDVKLSHDIIHLETGEPILEDVPATAEFTMALMLSSIKRIDEMLSDKHNYLDRDKFISCDIKDKKVLIIGLGRIGQKVAGYLDCMGARVFYVDQRNIDTKFSRLSLGDPLIQEMDIVSIHINYTKNNDTILDTKFFQKLKKVKIFINTARGELIDERALIDFAVKNPRCKIILDVLKDEQKNQGKTKLIGLKNVLITPHVGGNSIDSRQKVERYIVDKYCMLNNG